MNLSSSSKGKIIVATDLWHSAQLLCPTFIPALIFKVVIASVEVILLNLDRLIFELKWYSPNL